MKRILVHLVIGLFLAILLIWGSYFVATGILLGLLTLAGFSVLYHRIPLLKKFAVKYPAFFDVGAAVLTYWIFGATIIGLIAAAIAGLGTSFLLDIAIYKKSKQTEARNNAFVEAALV